MTTAATHALDAQPALVLRRGRHRNRALAAYRRGKAVELATSGRTYQQIADELGYASRGTVHRIVRQALEAHETEEVQTLRQLEVERLDALQGPLWEAAMAGDVQAALGCLRIVEARVRVLGLAATTKGNTKRCEQPQTVMLQENDCRTRGCPEHAA